MNYLTTNELKQISQIMAKVEEETYLPYKNISGGFAQCELCNYDSETIDIKVIYGNMDCDNDNHIEDLIIDRETMTIID